jgi:NADH:ubiquinone oxidoreductase subunit D
MSRSVGLKRDLRLNKLETYGNYYYLNFRSYIGQHGDCYDRFLIRMNEMSESINLINQTINKLTFSKTNMTTLAISNILPHNLLKFIHTNSFNLLKNNNYNSMESLISHFKY